jgi:CheY-like chemotaxis protein
VDAAALLDYELKKLDRPYSISRVTSEDHFTVAIEKDAFDLIISDSNLSGCDVLKILNFPRHRRPRIPFIVFSGNASPQLRQKALEHGASEVISKDSFPELIESLRRIPLPNGFSQ